jgi:hypothetical protein
VSGYFGLGPRTDINVTEASDSMRCPAEETLRPRSSGSEDGIDLISYKSSAAMMIVALYATLGVFLLMASRDPDAHKNIIWFTVWSSVVHGAIMGWQVFGDAAERGHLLGDVPALFLIAIVLGGLMSMGSSDRVKATIAVA